jgi:RNA polymerase sigma factor (sigma-70 family)
MTTATIESPSTWSRPSARTDHELARAAGRGDVAAFETLYERHHLALLSFSRHMLGRMHDAEDVVQHTFAAADRAFRDGRVPASVRAWLYTVARNRCISVLRARRDDQALPDSGLPSAQNLAADVEQREELRELLADLRTLPDDQRAALLLAELGDLSHAEVAQVLGVRGRKVKALVYQARQALMAAAGARAIPCRSIRAELAAATGAARRRRHLRDHVARCDGCRAYAAGVSRQRASIAAILPVVPTVALRDGVLACVGGGGAAAATGGAGAGLGVLGAKLLAITAIGGAAAGGGTVAVTQLEQSAREPRAARSPAPAPAPVAPAATVSEPAANAAPEPTDPVGSRRAAGRTREERASMRTATRAAPPATGKAPPATGKRPRTRPDAPPGLTRGRPEPRARGKTPGGPGAGKPEQAASKPLAATKSPAATIPARANPAAPVSVQEPKPLPPAYANPGREGTTESKAPVKTKR